jgi:predicted phage replisome organizer
MPDVKMQWIKIYTSIFDDEKIQLIEAMPDADTLLVIWFKLLVLAGKVTANGDIQFSEDMAYTDEMLATIFRRPLNSVRLALQVLSKFKMIKISDNSLCIVNWEKYQNIEGMDRIRQLTADRVRKFRERQQPLLLPVTLGNVTVTPQNKNKNKNKKEIENKNEEVEEERENGSSSCPAINLTIDDCFLTYEKEIGLLTPIIKDEIEKYSHNFPPDWIVDALVLASKNNHRSWGYTSGILKNWAVKGRDVIGKSLPADKTISRHLWSGACPLPPDDSAKSAWCESLIKIQSEINGNNYRTWFDKTFGIRRVNGDFIIGVPNTFVADYLGNNQSNYLKGVLSTVLGEETEIKFYVMQGEL